MTEKKINETIKRIEKLGYLLEWECESEGVIGIWTPRDEHNDRKYLKFKTWEEVDERIK